MAGFSNGLTAGWTLDALQHAGDDSDTLASFLPWLSVLGAWLCFGTFAVPMKWPSVIDANVHPLVFQCYKTFWTFVTAHLVLLFEPYEFTWWGILSGFSWVPAGVAAVIAVQNVGIARGQAIWQVTVIVTSLIWGFGIMQDEAVYSWFGTGLSFTCLVSGVVGMTLSFNLRSAPLVDAVTSSQASPIAFAASSALASATARAAAWAAAATMAAATESTRSTNAPAAPLQHGRTVGALPTISSSPVGGAEAGGEGEARERGRRWEARARSRSVPVGFSSSLAGPLVLSGVRNSPRARSGLSDLRYGNDDVEELADDIFASQQQVRASPALGMAAALFNGVWGGANLVPSHYAPYGGVRFVISFATGALIANITLVLLYVPIAKYYWKIPLPSPEFRVMAVPGFISGTLWSAGNFCSLYVVSTIGQGIGYSLVQSCVIVSGLWGILYYRELSGRPILYWSACCLVCIVGVLGLALEKKH